jgi:hypothetical protein
MFSIAFSSLFGQDAVNRRPAYAESSRNRARRLTARVHAPRQTRPFDLSSALSLDVLSAALDIWVPSRIPSMCELKACLL